MHASESAVGEYVNARKKSRLVGPFRASALLLPKIDTQVLVAPMVMASLGIFTIQYQTQIQRRHGKIAQTAD